METAEISNRKLKRKLNFLMAYMVISSVVFSVLTFTSFNKKDQTFRTDELTLKKLNIVGEDGTLRLVLSNETRQHPGRMDGKDLPKRNRPAGIIFFNTKGDECGGIISEVSSSQENVASSMSFTMDNYRDDQVLQILNEETYRNGKAKIQRGINIREYPEGTDMMSRNMKYEEFQKIKDPAEKDKKTKELLQKEGAKTRLFVGRNENSDSGLFLYDATGKPKMQIYVDRNGEPHLEILDDAGNSRSIIK